jgi:outer membrane protein TolC
MNIGQILLVAFSGILLSTQAQAQDAAPAATGPRFTLQEAFDAALRDNPGLHAAEEQVVQARINRDKAFAFISPKITASAAYRVNDREVSFDPSEGFGDTSAMTDAFGSVYENLGIIYGNMFANGQLDADDCEAIAVANGLADCDALIAGLDEGLVVDDGTSDTNTIEPTVITAKTQGFLSAELQWPLSPRVASLTMAGKHQLEGAISSVRRNKIDLLLGVTQAYAAAYQGQEGVRLLNDQLTQVGAHLRDVESLLAVGMATKDQLLRSRLEIEKVKRQLRQTEQQHRSAFRQLALAMGNPRLQIATVAPLPEFAVDAAASEEALTGEALDRRKDLKAARSQELAAKEMVIDSALQFLPAFALTGQLNWQDQASGFDNKQTSWNVGVAMSLPIWDGGLNIQNARESSSRRRQATLNIRVTEERIAVEVADALDAWTTAKGSVPVALLERELAEETLRLVRARYQAGAAREVEVIDASSAVRAAGLAVLQAEVGLQVAGAQLLAATGTFDVASGS